MLGLGKSFNYSRRIKIQLVIERGKEVTRLLYLEIKKVKEAWKIKIALFWFQVNSRVMIKRRRKLVVEKKRSKRLLS